MQSYIYSVSGLTVCNLYASVSEYRNKCMYVYMCMYTILHMYMYMQMTAEEVQVHVHVLAAAPKNNNELQVSSLHAGLITLYIHVHVHVFGHPLHCTRHHLWRQLTWSQRCPCPAAAPPWSLPAAGPCWSWSVAPPAHEASWVAGCRGQQGCGGSGLNRWCRCACVCAVETAITSSV